MDQEKRGHQEKKKRERIRRKKLRITLAAVGGLLVCFVIFIGVFYVPDRNAEVTGSSRYTEKEIREMVFGGFADRNSLYLCYVRKTIKPENAPFISSIHVEYTGHSSVRLVVNENSPVGYVQQDGINYYFDANGIVLEAVKDDNPTSDEEETESVVSSSAVSSSSVSSSSVSSSGTQKTDYKSLGLTATLVDLNGDGVPETDAEGNWLVDTDGDGMVDQTTSGVGLIDIDGDGVPDITQTDYDNAKAAKEEEKKEKAQASAVAAADSSASQTENGSDVLQAVSTGSSESAGGSSADTEYHPALTDVTRIIGLTDKKLTVGKAVPVSDNSVFSTIQALSRLISKFGIRPDKIVFDKDQNITLYYNDGKVKILLGQDTLLEDKMTKAAAILPQLSGMEGTLHLESYTEDTVNIIFDTTETGENSSDSSGGTGTTAASGKTAGAGNTAAERAGTTDENGGSADTYTVGGDGSTSVTYGDADTDGTGGDGSTDATYGDVDTDGTGGDGSTDATYGDVDTDGTGGDGSMDATYGNENTDDAGTDGTADGYGGAAY
ncbi:hypothetical protein [Bilifractor sp. HCP3S3_D3]|uniref:cell division protein FtsQ/DivIB n=1 Tax=Bilifractor sp. HCP3S3_D3 TaxID=3438907 RepID=UPI003F8A508E